MIDINKDNYMAYVELYQTFYFSGEEKIKVFNSTIISALITCFTTLGISFVLPSGFIYAMLLLCIFVPIIVANKMSKKIQNDKINKILQKYPFLDIKISEEELENTLRNANILKTIEHCHDILDVSYYEHFLRCEEIKKQAFEENRYDITFDNSIPEEEMENVREQVKTLVKKIK